ncbi:DUF5134 domain-containing protein [Streptomyces sp. NPDC018693]|uniref:DUF5134 domain-containing protein n=1 Tax=unclassified Streptomyces TaxID=2593676 RepID=UPI0037BA8214
MHGPASPGWLLVALCALTGVSCLLRMHGSAGERRRVAGDEALMGFGMAVMAVPATVFTPPEWAWPVYAAVFGAAALRALWSARTGVHHLHHLVGAAAMVYMALAMATTPRQTHAHGTGVPLLTGALLLYFAAYVLISGARLVPATASGNGGRTALRWGERPELARVCRLSMGIGMLAMLLTM